MVEVGSERVGRRGSVGGFLLRGGTWSLVARVSASLSGIGTQMLLARLVPPEDLGVYFLTQSVVAVAALVGQLGLNRTAVRHIAQSTAAGQPNRARGFVGPTLGLAALASGAIAILYALLLGPLVADLLFSSPVMGTATLVTGLWVLAMSLQNVVAEVFRGFHAIGPASVFGGALTSLIAVGCFAVIYSAGGQPSFDQVVWVTVAGTVANLALAGCVLHRLASGPRERPHGVVAMLMQSTLPVLGAGMLQAGFAQIDLWLVGAQFPQDDVALYGAAKRLMRLLSLPLVIINLVVPPLIVELHSRGESLRLQRAIRGASTLAGLPMLAMLALFVLAGAPVLEFVYGDFYRAGAPILFVLSIERGIFVWTGPCGIALMMTGNERHILRVTLAAGIVTLVGCLVGAQLWGVFGVAIGAAVGSITRNLLMWDASRRLCGIRTDVDLIRIGPMVEALGRAIRRQGRR
jgi:O-antigen/teichoic acid export membrane protein